MSYSKKLVFLIILLTFGQPETLIHAAHDFQEITKLSALTVLSADQPRSESEQKALNSALFAAVQFGHHDIVRALLAQGADINYKENSYNNPLLVATHHGHETIVRTLLEAGADATVTNKHNETLVMYAAGYDYNSILSLLLDYKLPVNSQNASGQTALMLAAIYYGSPKVTRLLIAAGADINMRCHKGKTALLWAAEKNKHTLATVLIDAGALINSQDNEGNSALLIAVRNSQAPLAQSLFLIDACSHFTKHLILAGACPHLANNKGDTAWTTGLRSTLHQALEERTALEHDPSLVHLSLLDQNTLNDVLINAAAAGDEQSIKQLLACGAHINAQKSTNGETALIQAAHYGHANTVRLLIDAQADINIQDNNGETALIKATQRENADIVNLLIENHAHIDTQNSTGDTALLKASQKSGSLRDHSAPIAAQLLNAKARTDIVNNNGETALMWALHNRCAPLIDHLIAVGACNDSTINTQSTTHGYTSLLCAASANHAQATRLLLNARADITKAKTENKETALYCASKHPGNRADTLRLLLDAHACPNTPISDGTTPLIRAVSYQSKDAIEQLILSDASLDHTNNEKKSAWDYADTSCKHTIVQALYQKELIANQLYAMLSDEALAEEYGLTLPTTMLSIIRGYTMRTLIRNYATTPDHDSPGVQKAKAWAIQQKQEDEQAAARRVEQEAQARLREAHAREAAQQRQARHEESWCILS